MAACMPHHHGISPCSSNTRSGNCLCLAIIVEKIIDISVKCYIFAENIFQVSLNRILLTSKHKLRYEKAVI